MQASYRFTTPILSGPVLTSQKRGLRTIFGRSESPPVLLFGLGIVPVVDL